MNTVILGGLLFILVLGGSILLHELGHFLAAKLVKIDVEEFAIGFPPRLAKLFTWKGTVFTLNWIPLGGFNRLKGEEDPGVPGGLASAKPWKRVIVMLGGPLFNLLTAVFVFSLYFTQVGIPDTKTVQVIGVETGSPAETAGIMVDDIVQTAAGETISNYNQLVAVTLENLDIPMVLGISRGGEPLEITVTPRSVHPADQGAMGIAISSPVNKPKTWFATIPISFQATGEYINTLLALPGRIIAGVISPQEAQLAGPRTIWNLFQTAVARDVASRETGASGGTAAGPTNYTLMIIISLTISLGVANLLPIPALDGGRIIMILPELILRKPIPAKFQAAINGVSFLILVILLGFFYIKDILHPLTITLP
jgi:regulator of sigma E protease